MRTLIFAVALIAIRSALAYTVHFRQQTSAGGVENLLSDITLDTGAIYETQLAPEIPGYGFTEWSISVRQAFSPRDFWGRARDFVSVDLYEATTMTANYLANNIDTDSDGIGDCYELYWYGDLDKDADSDEDGDGLAFVQELHGNTNPHFADCHVPGISSSGLVRIGGASLYQYDIPVCPDEPMFLGSGPSEDPQQGGGGGASGDEDGGDEPFENPYGYPVVTFRSEPVGLLFKTYRVAVPVGENVESEAYDFANTAFCQWELDGVRQADDSGIALQKVSFVMPSSDVNVVAVASGDEKTRAWYHYHGAINVPGADSDGDGLCDMYEQSAGINVGFPDVHIYGGVSSALSVPVEVDLQPHEQVTGMLLGNELVEVFYSPVQGNVATSWTFGRGIAPYVADVTGDGLWDIILRDDAGEVTVWENVGTVGNPSFAVRDVMPTGFNWLQNSISAVDGYFLDVPLYEAVTVSFGDVNGDGVVDLLASDESGRIWYYQNMSSTNIPLPSAIFELQHKAWAGTKSGFAEGLKIAAVDWDDDGDLDCLAGTADGKLMLLRDPKVGRPTNVKAFAGVDNVLLTWDPNAQSRIRGYRLYRAEGTQGTEATEVAFERIAQSQLPTYRDFPGASGAFDYKVSSVSRFYTAGNSTPTETESMTTEAIRAELGGVKFFWNDVAVKCGEQAAVMLSIENSMNYNVVGKSQTVVYDPEYLTPVKVVKSGLTEGFEVVDSVGRADPSAPTNGEWQITITGAVDGGSPTLPAGSGKFLTLVFETQKEGTTKVGGETGATVSIAARSVIAPYQLGDVDGDGDVDVEDLRLLAKLKNGNGRKHTANQLKAGDFNGNGKLDNADYQALRELLRGKGLLR